MLVKDFSIQRIILNVLESFSVCAVNCFMIVSGYFLFTNRKVRFGKIFDILLIVIFYRFFDYFCRIFFLHEPFALRKIVGCIFPANYFAIFYIICYLFSPFIAKIFSELSRKNVNFLIIAMLIVFIFIPTLLDIGKDLYVIKDPGFLSPISSQGNGGGYTIIQFFTMFCLGMYLRRIGINPKTWILVCIYIVSSFLIVILKRKINTYNYNFVLNVVNAVVLFLLFNKLSFQNRIINFAARSCFSIYCVHTGYFANIIWRKFFITEIHLCNGLGRMLFWTFISITIMFVACLIISIVLRGMFSKIKKRLCTQFLYFYIEKE